MGNTKRKQALIGRRMTENNPFSADRNAGVYQGGAEYQTGTLSSVGGWLAIMVSILPDPPRPIPVTDAATIPAPAFSRTGAKPLSVGKGSGPNVLLPRPQCARQW